ncbi:MAG: hypothetical protein C0596_14305 [Marinilabiliales bacterium]|nr:MAG: hypothetical protein C0596_14305 [Marinilabiliales bacterium]
MIIALSCYNPQIAEVEQSPSYKYNFSSLYNPSETSIHPQVKVFVKSDTEATVFFKLSTEEIKANLQSQMDTSFKLVVKYALRDVATFEIVDSGVNIFNINPRVDARFIGSSFNINLIKGSQNKLIVGFTGPKAYSGSRMIFDIDNSSDFSNDRFILEKKELNGYELVFDNFVKSGRNYRISSNTFDKYSFNVSLYGFDDYIVIPPYYIADPEEVLPEPDSLFTYTVGDSISFDSIGYYVFRASSNSEGVFCLLNAGNTFPEIEILSDMYEPLKLVATNRELNSIKE